MSTKVFGDYLLSWVRLDSTLFDDVVPMGVPTCAQGRVRSQIRKAKKSTSDLWSVASRQIAQEVRSEDVHTLSSQTLNLPSTP